MRNKLLFGFIYDVKYVGKKFNIKMFGDGTLCIKFITL